MSKYIYSIIIVLGGITSTWCQDVKLYFKTNTDSTKVVQELKFNSFDEAEKKLNFKIDSLKKKGYPFISEIRSTENKSIFSTVELNQKIDSIYIKVKEEHLNLIPKELVSKHTVKIHYSELQNFQEYVLNIIKDEGSPFGKTSLTEIRVKDKSSIEAEFNISKGQTRTIDKINVKGYTELSEAIVGRYSNLKTGKIFNEEEIQNKTKQLNNTPYLNVKKPTEVLFKKDSTELFVYLEKVNSNSFDGFLGFGSTEEDGFQLNGYLNMVLLNNLNFGERLGIVYKNDGIGQQTFEGDIKLPFIFKSPLSLEAGLRLFRRDSSFSNSTQHLSLNYQLNERLSAQGGIELTNSTGLESDEINIEINDFSSTFYEIGLNFIKLNAREGFEEDTFISLKGGIGNRISEEQSEQYKLSIEGQHQIPLNYRNKIYVNFSSQLLVSDSFLNNELYRFGGVNSIRGFTENSLIANRFAILQTEYRYLLDTNLYANTVIDLGNYKNKLDDVNENILGYGIGLGLKSKAGIFRLIVANAIAKNQNSTFGNSKIHISFTSFF